MVATLLCKSLLQEDGLDATACVRDVTIPRVQVPTRDAVVRPSNMAVDGASCPLSSFRMPDSFKKHPGGQNLLETARATDSAGLLFLSYHMGSDLAGKVLPAAKALGTITPQRGPLYDELHEAIRKVKADNRDQHNYFVAWCLMLSASFPAVLLWWLARPSLPSSAILATVVALYFLNVFHTRHHYGGHLYQHPLLNKVTSHFYDFVDETWGYNPKAWREEHHVKHHMFTNQSEIDNTLPAIYPAIRCCEDQPKKWFHKLQTFYWPLLAGLTAASFPVNNVIFHGGSKVSFLIWSTLMFMVPYHLHGLVGLLYSMLVQALAGTGLAYAFAVSHTHSDIGSFRAEAEKYHDVDKWLTRQIEESMSWGGYASTFILGGINMQIEHHICPVLDPPLYHFISAEIKRICVKYDIRYTAEPSFIHAVWQFHLKLWAMG